MGSIFSGVSHRRVARWEICPLPSAKCRAPGVYRDRALSGPVELAEKRDHPEAFLRNAFFYQMVFPSALLQVEANPIPLSQTPPACQCNLHRSTFKKGYRLDTGSNLARRRP